jgi:hypothetical protein
MASEPMSSISPAPTPKEPRRTPAAHIALGRLGGVERL